MESREALLAERDRLTAELAELRIKEKELREELWSERKHAIARLKMKIMEHFGSVGTPSEVLLYEIKQCWSEVPQWLRNPKARRLMCEIGTYEDFRQGMGDAKIWDSPVPPQKKKRNWKLLNE